MYFLDFHLAFRLFAKIRWLNSYIMQFVCSSKGAANWLVGGGKTQRLATAQHAATDVKTNILLFLDYAGHLQTKF